MSFITPWHKESFDRFLTEGLPDLLAERLPLTLYEWDLMPVEEGHRAVCIRIAVNSPSGDVEAFFRELPYLSDNGVFDNDEQRLVIVPFIDSAALDTGSVSCAGEQALDYCRQRLGYGTAEMPWDEGLLSAFVPLDIWLNAFLREYGQVYDETNWFARQIHLRRIKVKDDDGVRTTGFLGRVCPLDTPEGPTFTKILTVALGARIVDRKLLGGCGEIPEILGPAAAMIPFLQYSDPARTLMGATLMHQMEPLPDAEEALVKTGEEPEDAWFGKNLLTAFTPWGRETFGDGIVISESAAQKLSGIHSVEEGDKLANRHGSKGIVSRILPDCQMPTLPDGTAVEVIFSSIALHTRMNHGQLLEASAGRIAHLSGKSVVAPPFGGPSPNTLKKKLAELGLDPTGIDTLRIPSSNEAAYISAAVGYVYWGVNRHFASKSLFYTGAEGSKGQMQGAMEYFALRDAGACELIAEQFNTRSIENTASSDLCGKLHSGPASQGTGFTPIFNKFRERLIAAGINCEITDTGLSFRFADNLKESANARVEYIRLAAPLPHPWQPERSIETIGVLPQIEEFRAVVKENERLAKLISSKAPGSLIDKSVTGLSAKLRKLFKVLLTPGELVLSGRSLFSGRGVIAPSRDLKSQEVGIPYEMAWSLFGPMAARELGGTPEAVRLVEKRSSEASRALVDAMSKNWVLIDRAPTLRPSAILALKPIPVFGRTLRLHPMVCTWLDADFDGDQAAVFVPITEAGQKEAGEKLSVRAHLERDAELLEGLLPKDEALLGSLITKDTRNITSRGDLIEYCRSMMSAEGIDIVLGFIEQLWDSGFDSIKRRGLVMPVIPSYPSDWPLLPDDSANDEALELYRANVSDIFASRGRFMPFLSDQTLAVSSGARGSCRQLVRLAAWGSLGRGYLGGLVFEDWLSTVAETWNRFIDLEDKWSDITKAASSREYGGVGVLARARRSGYPGVVIARAASTGEVDPLTDIDTRLFIGIR